MKLFECKISSGSISHGHPTVYVVAESYSDAELLLIAHGKDYFVWNHNQKIESITGISDNIIVSKEK